MTPEIEILADYEPGAMEWLLGDLLAERGLSLDDLTDDLVDALLRGVRHRVFESQLQFCIPPNVPMAGTHDAIFRLYLGQWIPDF